MTFRIDKSDRILILFFCLLSSGILFNYYHHPHGFLSPYSNHFLAIAQNLLNGKGYFEVDGQGTRFNSILQVGYSTLIFTAAKILKLNIVLASKVVNLLAIGLSLAMFRKLFGKQAWIYGTVFFIGNIFSVFCNTLAEGTLIFCLIWLNFALIQFERTKKNHYLSYMVLAALLAFFVRYIGIFSLGLFLGAGFYYFSINQKKESCKIFSVLILSGLGMGLFLYYNYLETGFISGAIRKSATETPLELIIMYSKALVREFNLIYSNISYGFNTFNVKLFLISFAAELVLLFAIFGPKLKTEPTAVKPDICFYLFFGTGLIYIMLVTIIRWKFKLDPLGARFMAPFTAMVYLALIRWVLLKAGRKLMQKVKQFVIIMALCSFVLNIPLRAMIYHYHGYSSYPKTLNLYREKYRSLPEKSIIITTNTLHLKYLRPDLKMIDLNNHTRSTIDQIISTVTEEYPPPQKIFLDLPGSQPFENYYHQISKKRFGLFTEKDKLLKIQ
jgi:hypothetical protein